MPTRWRPSPTVGRADDGAVAAIAPSVAHTCAVRAEGRAVAVHTLERDFPSPDPIQGDRRGEEREAPSMTEHVHELEDRPSRSTLDIIAAVLGKLDNEPFSSPAERAKRCAALLSLEGHQILPAIPMPREIR